MLLVQGVLLQLIYVLQVEPLSRLNTKSILAILERLLLLLLYLYLLLEELSNLRILHKLLELVHRNILPAGRLRVIIATLVILRRLLPERQILRILLHIYFKLLRFLHYLLLLLMEVNLLRLIILILQVLYI